jgi:hypothetical protein
LSPNYTNLLIVVGYENDPYRVLSEIDIGARDSVARTRAFVGMKPNRKVAPLDCEARLDFDVIGWE